MLQLWGDDYPEEWIDRYNQCQRNQAWLCGCVWAVVLAVIAGLTWRFWPWLSQYF